MKIIQSQKPLLSMKAKVVGASALFIVLTLIVVRMIMPGVSEADTERLVRNYWVGDEGAEWFEPVNWSLGEVPDHSHIVVMKNSGEARSTVEIEKRDAGTIAAIELEGVDLIINGELEVKSHIQLNYRAEVLLNGKLLVREDIYVLNKSRFRTQSGRATVEGDLIIDRAWANIAGGEFRVKNDLYLRRKESNLMVSDGWFSVEGDMILHASTTDQNRVAVSGGEMAIMGNTVFTKNQRARLFPAIVEVNNGSLTLNNVTRSSNTKGYFPSSYSFRVEGGVLTFNRPIVMDTLAKGEVYRPTVCESTPAWDSTVIYSRFDENDVVKVNHKGYCYWLATAYWKSVNNEPGKDGHWYEMGKCGEVDKSRSSGYLDLWQAAKLYERQNDQQEVFVLDGNQVYRMNRTCNLSKGNKPGENPWAWIPWYQVLEDTSNFNDKLSIVGGRVVFNDQWIHPKGFHAFGDANVVLNGNGISYQLKPGDRFHHLTIGYGARIRKRGDVFISGNLVNNYSKMWSGYGNVILVGNAVQNVAGSALVIDNLVIDKDSHGLMLKTDVNIIKKLNWKSATAIYPARSVSRSLPKLVFAKNAVYSGDGWFEGSVEKQGSKPFVFPVGQNGHRTPFRISGLSDTATFRLTYYQNNVPGYLKTEKEVDRVSQIEYWQLSQTQGALQQPQVTLYWHNSAQSCIDHVSDLVVARYGGNSWESLGQGQVAGDVSGSISAKIKASGDGYFTFGSISASNPLSNGTQPMQVFQVDDKLAFYHSWLPDGLSDQGYVLASVDSTFGEYDSIVIFRSGKRYTGAGRAGDYEYFKTVIPRLKGGDFETLAILNERGLGVIALNELELYPNPVSDQMNLKFRLETKANIHMEVLDMNGVAQLSETEVFMPGANSWSQSVLGLTAGYYMLRLSVANDDGESIRFLKL